MKRYALSALFVSVLFFAAPKESAAKPLQFNMGLSLNSSYTFHIGNGERGTSPLQNFGASLELLPSLQFLFISADLGIHYNFVQNAMTLRPGVRFFLGWFYLRAALPLAFSFRTGTQTSPFDLGVLVGAGVRFKFGALAFVAEANVSPFFMQTEQYGVSMPAELRLGLTYHF